MCHETDSRPPAFGESGRITEQGALVLTAGDGTRFSALHAFTAATGDPAGVIILPDARGTHPYYDALARRFAANGFNAVVVDYYGRTAGPGARDADFPWREHFPHLDPADVTQDVRAAHDFLRAHGDGPVVVVGFCYGGGQSWMLAAGDLELAGCVGFYGLPAFAAGVVDEIHVPLLLLLAGEDVATGPAEFDAFTARLDAAGKDYEKHVYAGAPHSFFDAAYDEWQDACRDAWSRTLDFIQRRTSAVGA
ncbi:dienelactone hydrolase family protein [Streptosporangium longisporum]|uniref:Dienelactone hydrolase domain-containing protein n=1 Tax=Streptosporangium longisporum TaxID=46187 RepID=A0ABP6L4Q9_9ACTN